MHTNDNSSWWNQQTAMWLKSIVHQKTELLSSQDVDTLKLLEMIWGKMAKIIDFDFTNDKAAIYIDTNSSLLTKRNEKTFEVVFNGKGEVESLANYQEDGNSKNYLNDMISKILVTYVNGQITLQIPNEIFLYIDDFFLLILLIVYTYF